MVDEGSFSSLVDLTKASSVVVSAKALPKAEPIKGFDPAAPIAFQSFEVETVIKGTAREGSDLSVAVGARLLKADIDEEAGVVRSWDGLETTFKPGTRYLLYLTTSPVGNVMTPTSTLTSAIAYEDRIGFVKPNSANPGVPDVITLEAAREAVDR
jgi:hypothetical protein